MTETVATFRDPDMPNITDLGIKRPKMDGKIAYLKINNNDKSTLQNMRKRDVYESDMHKIYNLIVGQTNEKLQEKAASGATFQAVKTYQ